MTTSTTRVDEKHFCRVCGIWNEAPPWGDDGDSPEYDYCVCCGVEHGYQDISPAGVRQFREKWLKKGAQWDDPKFKPENWDLEKQLSQIPESFR